MRYDVTLLHDKKYLSSPPEGAHERKEHVIAEIARLVEADQDMFVLDMREIGLGFLSVGDLTFEIKNGCENCFYSNCCGLREGAEIDLFLNFS